MMSTILNSRPVSGQRKLLCALILFFLILIQHTNGQAQQNERKFRLDTNYVNPDPSYLIWGIQAGGYYTRYKLNTLEWLGDNNNSHVSFFVKYNKIGLGFNFKLGWVNPYAELTFNDEIMTKFTQLNVHSSELYLSYSLDFPYGFSLEPYAGLNRTGFTVINEDKLNQEFNLNRAPGYFVGGKLHRYWRLQSNTGTEFQEDTLFSIYADYYYSWTDFTRVQHRLTNNFFSWGFGVSFILVLGYK